MSAGAAATPLEPDALKLLAAAEQHLALVGEVAEEGALGQAGALGDLGNGHQVVGLARSDASAEAVAALGAEPRRGDLDDLDDLDGLAAAAEADGVIHLAFKHEAMRTGDFAGAVDSDMAAHQAIGQALLGTDRPFVSAGGR